jgi:hypothetical protein
LENFPHKGFISSKRVPQKRNIEKEISRKSLNVKTWFYLFLLHNSSSEATELARKAAKLSSRANRSSANSKK